MRKPPFFTSSLLLATLPPLLVYPQHPSPQVTFPVQRVTYEEQRTEKDYTLSYDDMIHLLDEVESGELENKGTPEELEKVKHFIAFLAKEGVLPDHSEESLSLDHDIEDLLNGEDNIYENALSFVTPGTYPYMIVPAGLHRHGDIVLCKSWAKKQWKHVKKFAKKHKKALLIGAAIVVATAVVVVAVAAASSAPAGAAAGAAGAAGAATGSPDPNHKSDKKDQQESSSSVSVPTDVPPGMAATREAPILQSTIDNQISAFKENLIQNPFFQPTNPGGQQGLSWQENGRALGSLFAHDSYNSLQSQLPYHLRLAQEAQEIHAKHRFPVPGWDQGAVIGHAEIDRSFSTDYSHLYSNPAQQVDWNTLSHQVRGERALSLGYYKQAVQDLGKAIETNPSNPLPYLERGIAHFGLGDYDRSLDDYKQFTSHSPAQKANPLSISAFSVGFAKGFPKGVYESGEGLFLFMGDFVRHPVQTSRHIVDSVSTLVDLVRKDEWGVVGEALFPEVHELVTQWDTLPAEERGKLAGYAVGKYGADLVVPGALAKVARKSVHSAQELAAVCKNLQGAQDILLLETAAGIGNTAKIAEIVEGGQRTARVAEAVGFSGSEMGKLKQAGQLETTVSNTLDCIAQNPTTKQSFELFDKAQEFLKPYREFMSETRCRELIHKAGIQTFPRPSGIPHNFRVRISDKGAGLIYIHPDHTHTSIRVMPGKPHSPLPYQRKPYVIHMKDGKALDKFGNKLWGKELPEAHIPYDKFVYRG